MAHDKDKLKKSMWDRVPKVLKISLSVFLICFFLEGASALLLGHVIHPSRLDRFKTLYDHFAEGYNFIPHPFLKYVEPSYIAEKERYIGYVGANRSDIIYIVALGGSTTRSGYPRYLEEYLRGRLTTANKSLKVVVFNFGVDGWSTLQCIQNYFYLLKYLHPDFIIVHENHNEGNVQKWLEMETVEYYPDFRALDSALVHASRFYRLLRFLYFVSYNGLHYRQELRGHAIIEGKEDYPMAARISAYLNEKDPDAFLPRFFERDYIKKSYPSVWLTKEFILTENYESLIRYAKADNAVVILTTQYQNFSKAPQGKYLAETAAKFKESHETNEIIRNISRKNGVPLVDLASEMEPYDSYLIKDEVHFNEEGIQIVGRLVGERVWDLMKTRYNLTGGAAP